MPIALEDSPVINMWNMKTQSEFVGNEKKWIYLTYISVLLSKTIFQYSFRITIFVISTFWLDKFALCNIIYWNLSTNKIFCAVCEFFFFWSIENWKSNKHFDYLSQIIKKTRNLWFVICPFQICCPLECVFFFCIDFILRDIALW